MNRILRILLLLVVAFTVGRHSHESSANARVADRLTACQDVNGDGQSDVADAVFLLTWLFLGGAEPQCPTNDEPSGLPATGETTCYDHDRNVVDCASDTCPGRDGVYQAGCPTDGRFVDNGDGTVTDSCTKLMWQKDVGSDRSGLDWCSALVYCENLELGGHDDWRLPNIRELQSIVDYGRECPGPDGRVFNDSPPGRGGNITFWSSTTYTGEPSLAWGLHLGGPVSHCGVICPYFEDDGLRVRSVRGP